MARCSASTALCLLFDDRLAGQIREDHLEPAFLDLGGHPFVGAGVGDEEEFTGLHLEDLAWLDPHLLSLTDGDITAQGDDGGKPFLFPQVLGDIVGGAGVRHPHEQLGVAVVEDCVGPILAHFGIQLADRLAVAVDEHSGPTGFGKEILDALVEDRLGLVDMEHQRWRYIPPRGIDPADKGLDHGDDYLAGGISGPLGQQRAQLHHQDDALAFFQPLDEAVFVSLADDLADIARGQLGERHPQRTGHLGIIVRRSRENLLDVQGELLGLGAVDVVDLLLELLQVLVADVVLDVVEVKRWLMPGLLGQQNKRLNHHQADLIGHTEEIGFPADSYPGGDMGHQLLGHVVGRQRIEDGAVLGKDRRYQHQIIKPVGLMGQLRDLGEQIDITFGINGHHRIPLADILLDDVFHDPGLAHPGGAKTPEMPLAVTVG